MTKWKRFILGCLILQVFSLGGIVAIDLIEFMKPEHKVARVDDTDQYGVGPCWHFNGADLSKTTWTWVCSGEPPRVCPEGFCAAIIGNNGDFLDSGCACIGDK